MASTKKSQETQTKTKRSNLQCEEFTLGVSRLKDFYHAVSVLNKELGHGNWTARGRPVRKLRRIDRFNNFALMLDRRKLDIVFVVPKESSYIFSKLMLELQHR